MGIEVDSIRLLTTFEIILDFFLNLELFTGSLGIGGLCSVSFKAWDHIFVIRITFLLLFKVHHFTRYVGTLPFG